MIDLSVREHLRERYSFCDPAAGKKATDIKNVQCDSAIVTVGVDWLGRIYCLDLFCERVRTDMLVAEIIRTNEKWQPAVFGIEANAMQSLFADAVSMHAQQNKIALPVRHIEQPKKISKEWRIRSALQPALAEGRLFFHESQVSLMKQIEAFPRGRKVDGIDALASAVMMVPRRMLKKAADDGDERFAAYLRSRGAPPHYIEQRMKQRREQRESFGARKAPVRQEEQDEGAELFQRGW